VSKSAYDRYRRSPARADYVDFPGMPHLLMVAPGWEKVAGYVADWLEQVLP